MARTPLSPLERRALLGVLAVLGLALLAATVRGVFIIDENHYLATVRALSQGRVTAPDFDGMGAALELAHFDPVPLHRPKGFTSTNAPPLYAVLALPFYRLGYGGLYLINLLALLGTGVMVFFYAREHARRAETAWLALGAFLLGSYSLEYAVGMWPHMLSVVLCTGGVVLAARVRGGGPPWQAAVAGLLAGLAVGIRYQNIVIAGCLGLGLLLFAQRKRLAASAAYALGVCGPLLACAYFNYLRLGSWNPISKGRGYLSLTAGKAISTGGGQPEWGPGAALRETLWVLWSKVVDFSTHKVMSSRLLLGPAHRDPESGAYVFASALKKALLQSAPWIVVALAIMALAWWPRSHMQSDKRRELRGLSLAAGGLMAVVGLAGFARSDGLAFNQRYFLELLPLFAVALAWAVEELEWRSDALVVGGMVGAAFVVGLLYLFDPREALRQLALQKAPLLLAAALLVAWFAARTRRLHKPLAALLGACLCWSMMLHVGEDLYTARKLRAVRRDKLEAVERVLPDGPVAVFAYGEEGHALAPLQIDRDLLIANPMLDHGAGADRLVRRMLRSGRRVYVLERRMPADVHARITRGRRVEVVSKGPYKVLEVLTSGSSSR